MTPDQTMKLFLSISIHRMCDQYLSKISKCIEALTREQLWERGVNQTNSLGGILLHICEQVYRNTLQYRDKGVVFQSGIEDYFPDLGLSCEELMRKVDETFKTWEMAVKSIAANSPTAMDMHRTYHLVEHTSYHLGQLVDRVQIETGKSFKFVQSGLNERNLSALIEEDGL